MFDIGFWELVVIAVVGLLVLGPERLPVAIRTVTKLFKTVRDTANSVKAELSQELRMEELHRDLKKAEQFDIKHLSPELRESVEQLKEVAASVTRPYEKKARPDAEANLSLEPEAEADFALERELASAAVEAEPPQTIAQQTAPQQTVSQQTVSQQTIVQQTASQPDVTSTSSAEQDKS